LNALSATAVAWASSLYHDPPCGLRAV